MKYLLLGDCHFRVRAPARRTETDFKQVCLDKLEKVCEIFGDRGCHAMVQAGDLFDSPNPSGELLADVIELLKNYRIPFSGVCGQHDLAYHTEASMMKSAQRIMEAAEVFYLLRPYADTFSSSKELTGASFGQEPPPAPDNCEFPVLIAHTMVGDKPLWPSHDLTAPAAYVKLHPGYALYVLGDYHFPFQEKVGNAWVINPGCLIRQNATARELAHHPQVVIFDTETRQPTNIELPGVTPASKAFDLTGLDEEAPTRQFEAFTRSLQETGQIGVSFKENLQAFFEKHKTAKAVRERVWAALETK